MREMAARIAAGEPGIAGLMMESFIEGGNQPAGPLDPRWSTAGRSPTAASPGRHRGPAARPGPRGRGPSVLRGPDTSRPAGCIEGMTVARPPAGVG